MLFNLHANSQVLKLASRISDRYRPYREKSSTSVAEHIRHCIVNTTPIFVSSALGVPLMCTEHVSGESRIRPVTTDSRLYRDITEEIGKHAERLLVLA